MSTFSPQTVTERYSHGAPRKIQGVICSDGKQRTATLAPEADTFFSVPARVSAYGKTVSGFIVSETLEGYDTATDDDPAVYKFIAYKYGKNAAQLPEVAYKS